MPCSSLLCMCANLLGLAQTRLGKMQCQNDTSPVPCLWRRRSLLRTSGGVGRCIERTESCVEVKLSEEKRTERARALRSTEGEPTRLRPTPLKAGFPAVLFYMGTTCGMGGGGGGGRWGGKMAPPLAIASDNSEPSGPAPPVSQGCRTKSRLSSGHAFRHYFPPTMEV